MNGDIRTFLTSGEDEALKEAQELGDRSKEAAFLQSVFERLYRYLDTRFERVDLDLAFYLLETPESPLPEISEIFWDKEELSAVGDLFFSWAEDRALDLSGRLSVDDWGRWLDKESFWRTLAEETLPPEGSEIGGEEGINEDEGAVAELVAADPTLEAEVLDREAEEPVSEDSILEPLEEIEVRPEFLGPDESVAAEALDFPEELGEPERVELPDLSEQETLALGAAARQAVAKAELQAVRRERIQAILKTSLETVPPLLPLEITPIVEIEPDEGAESRAEQPASRAGQGTLLYSSSRARGQTVTQEQDGEELSFSQAPVSPFEKKNQLVIKNRFLGYGKNSEGVVGLCGQLKITLFHPDELRGKLESSNPLLFFTPVQLSGTSTTVTYWLPPVAFPHPAGQLYVRESRDSKTLSLHSLFPKSRTDYLRGRQVLAALFAPSLLGCLYFFLVYCITVHGIDRESNELFPELYEAALEGVKSVDFRAGGLGLYRLRVVPASESLQMIWAGVLFLGPLLSSKFFHYLSRSRKRRLGGPLAGALLMPSLLLLTAWNFQDRVLPLHDHKDFAPLALSGLLEWSLPLNIVLAVYLFLSNFGFWDRWIRPREARIAMPVVLTLLYMVLMFGLIYGRSWLS